MSSFSSLIPVNDEFRLEAVHQYRHLSVQGEELLDDLVNLTAKLFAAPIAVVSLVEKETIRVVGITGTPDGASVARYESLCSVTILRERTTVFESLTDAPCSLVDPWLIECLNLQFYAGHPLCTPQGYAIGSLCIIDFRARAFSVSDQKLLASLAKVVMRLLELRVIMAQNVLAAPAKWSAINRRITPPLARIQTLAELRGRHEDPDTTVIHFYRKAVREETALIARILKEEVLALLVPFS
jgi:GAF domain-containing protein